MDEVDDTVEKAAEAEGVAQMGFWQLDDPMTNV